MPHYLEEDDRKLLKKLRLTNVCAECSGRLEALYDLGKHQTYLQCKAHPEHEGIAKPYREPRELNILTRREKMVNEHGEEKTKALDKARLPMTGALTQPQAMHILKLVYPNVPEDQIIRTAILCRDFGLHPLMKEVYIIGFNNRSGGVDFSTVIGITASRKMAADRKGAYSFLDDTPRAATHEEIVKQFGQDSEEEKSNLVSICKLKGEKGNEATGFGLWPKNKAPYGIDKGNTQRNMANIRSERPAYNRLPGEALPAIEVIDDAYAEVPGIGKVAKKTGEIIEGEFNVVEAPKEHWCEEHNCQYDRKVRGTSIWYAHKLADGKWCNEKKKAEASTEELSQPEPEPSPEPKPERDLSTIKTINDLYKACNEDFKNAEERGMQPGEVIAELGFNTQSDISDTPAECYQKIAAVRQ